MRINWIPGSAFVLAVLFAPGCVSTKAADTTIPDDRIRANHLYGYEIQTPFRGKHHVFAYGDIRIEGTVTQYLNSTVQGVCSKKQTPFRGNAEYAVDMTIEDTTLRGKIKVELDCFKVDLSLNGSELCGSIDFKTRCNSFDLVVGNKTLKGDYTYILRIAGGQLQTSDFSFDICQGSLHLDGQITYKYDTYDMHKYHAQPVS
jgi:hypothetical protein